MVRISDFGSQYFKSSKMDSSIKTLITSQDGDLSTGDNKIAFR